MAKDYFGRKGEKDGKIENRRPEEGDLSKNLSRIFSIDDFL